MGHPQSMSRMHIQKLKIIVWVVQTELWINTEELIDIKSIINTHQEKILKKGTADGTPCVDLSPSVLTRPRFSPPKDLANWLVWLLKKSFIKKDIY